MASNLVPERPLVFSPTLAATIGLEEAILLQVLMDFTALRKGEIHEQRCWVEISDHDLQQALPFWERGDIRRVEASLNNLGMILRTAGATSDRSCRYALNEKVSPNESVSPNEIVSPKERVSSKERISSKESVSPNEHMTFNKPEAPNEHRSPRVDPGRSAADSDQAAATEPSRIFRQGAGAGLIAPDWLPGAEWLAQCRQHNIPDQFSLSLVPEFVNYWRERGQAQFSWGNKFCNHVRRRWREEQTRQGAHELASTMDPGWRPSEDAREILVNSGIPHDFIDDAIPEFVLYWRERGISISTWNTKFIEHIRRQWNKYNASFGHDDTPRPIPADWQPSAACFEILQLAEIDPDYARSKIAEFVLYWRDSQQARPSWNTVFLQFIKQDWARRLDEPLEVESSHAQHKSAAGESRHSIEEKLRQLTDRSWAESARRW